jgi:hypothetical protein
MLLTVLNKFLGVNCTDGSSNLQVVLSCKCGFYLFAVRTSIGFRQALTFCNLQNAKLNTYLPYRNMWVQLVRTSHGSTDV